MAPTAMRIGYWGEVTSTLDWCERNYEINYYFAEFWNTISNVAMILPPMYSFFRSGTVPKDLHLRTCYVLLTTVGIGSWLFHMTLKYQMQLFDELPMLWGSLFLVFLLAPVVWEKTEDSVWLKIALVAYGLIATAAYLTLKHPLLFQICYGVLVAFVLFLNIYIARHLPSIAKFFYYSAALYYLGFFIWNLDNYYCDYLTRLRQTTAICFKPFTQGHAIWHIFAGYGSYLQIYFTIPARAMKRGIRVTVERDWISLKLNFPDFVKPKV